MHHRHVNLLLLNITSFISPIRIHANTIPTCCPRANDCLHVNVDDDDDDDDPQWQCDHHFDPLGPNDDDGDGEWPRVS